MLTTGNSGPLGKTVITDVNANVAVGAAPEPAKVSPELALLMNQSIVARPLMAPEVCSLHIKNTEYRYRWVNRDGQGGRIYMQRKTQGFINATTDDVDVLGGDAAVTGGEIRAGDLILMKIRADIYDAAMKYNMIKADVLSAARRQYDLAMAEKQSSKVSSFTPSATEADRIIDQSVKSGRVNDTRKVVDSLRADAPAKS